MHNGAPGQMRQKARGAAPCAPLVHFKLEREPRLQLDHAPSQSVLDLTKRGGSTGVGLYAGQRIYLYGSDGLVRERSEIHMVEKIVEVCANIQLCGFAE